MCPIDNLVKIKFSILIKYGISVVDNMGMTSEDKRKRTNPYNVL